MVFIEEDFTKNTFPVYSDPEGDAVHSIRFQSITPVNGLLDLNGHTIVNNEEVLMSDVVAGNLSWIDDGLNTSSHTSTFQFKLSDVGSLSFSSMIGTFTIEVDDVVNLPPSSVGDGEADINYGETLVFTRLMFTDTNPAYSDPESDPAGLLKITSLPSDGLISLDGVNVYVNQEVDFNDIDAGKLTYVGHSLRTISSTSGNTSSFSFEIADTVSGIFVA